MCTYLHKTRKDTLSTVYGLGFSASNRCVCMGAGGVGACVGAEVLLVVRHCGQISTAGFTSGARNTPKLESRWSGKYAKVRKSAFLHRYA